MDHVDTLAMNKDSYVAQLNLLLWVLSDKKEKKK